MSASRAEPVGFALLGGAAIARRSIVPALGSLAGARIEVLASRDAERRAELGATLGVRTVERYEAALADAAVEAVYIGLPNALHENWTLRALEAGKHVYCDKPAALDEAGATRLARAARARGLMLMDGFMFLFHPQQAEVSRLLASGAIGEPRQLEAWFGFPPLDAGNIRRSAALGGGALNDAAGYTLHAARRLFGREPSVLAGRRYRSAASEVDERGVALLELGPGIVGQIAYGWGHGYRNGYTVWGSEGRLSLERAFSVPPDHAPTIVLRDRNGREERRQLAPANHFELALGAFVAAIRGEAEREPFLVDLEAGARMLERLRDASPILMLPAEQPG